MVLLKATMTPDDHNQEIRFTFFAWLKVIWSCAKTTKFLVENGMFDAKKQMFQSSSKFLAMQEANCHVWFYFIRISSYWVII